MIPCSFTSTGGELEADRFQDVETTVSCRCCGSFFCSACCSSASWPRRRVCSHQASSQRWHHWSCRSRQGMLRYTSLNCSIADLFDFRLLSQLPSRKFSLNRAALNSPIMGRSTKHPKSELAELQLRPRTLNTKHRTAITRMSTVRGMPIM